MAPVGGKGKGKKTKIKSPLYYKTSQRGKGTELRGGKGAVSNLWADVIPKITKTPPHPFPPHPFPPPPYLYCSILMSLPKQKNVYISVCIVCTQGAEKAEGQNE